MSNKTLESRFWQKVEKRGADDCWLWMASTNGRGYGQFWVGNGKLATAHRVAYELTNGPLPDEDLEGNRIFVCHRCDNPPCCNPAHLFGGTHADNMADMYGKGRGPDRRGESHPLHKLTAKDVRSIRRRYTGRRGEQAAFAREFGVSPVTIHSVINGEAWTHAET